MNRQQGIQIRDWFKQYTDTYKEDGDLHRFLQWKFEHSARVARDAAALATDLQWSQEDIYLAEALGWLHDVGRFSQFKEFQCFHDGISVDHGLRGWEDLQKQDILDICSTYDQHILLTSVRHHNARTLPPDLDSECERFLKLIRDADKLDIYLVVEEVIEAGESERFAEMLPGVDIHAPPNPILIHELQTTGSGSYSHAHSLADILLIQLCWIYQLNYVPTFQCVADRNLISRISANLPDEPSVHHLIDNITAFIETTLSTGQKPEPVFA